MSGFDPDDYKKGSLELFIATNGQIFISINDSICCVSPSDAVTLAVMLLTEAKDQNLDVSAALLDAGLADDPYESRIRGELDA